MKSNDLIKDINISSIKEAEEIIKKAGSEELFEKAHNDGDLHPTRPWIWVSSANKGKGDWRLNRNHKPNTPQELDEKIKKMEEKMKEESKKEKEEVKFLRGEDLIKHMKKVASKSTDKEIDEKIKDLKESSLGHKVGEDSKILLKVLEEEQEKRKKIL